MNPQEKVKILFFAKSRELVGCSEVELELPRTITHPRLKECILQVYPSLEAIADVLVLAHNQEYLDAGDAEFELRSGDEIAVIPPISGGLLGSQTALVIPGMADFIEILDTPLSLEAISHQVTSPSSGAISLFIGTTRNNFEGRCVVQLEYEAYTPMAKLELKKICKSIREKWPDIEHIALYHRTGLVPITEASVIIAISSPHRQDSLQAVQFAIDTLKATVPIWKKEVYADSEPEWKANKECAWNS